MEELRFMKYNLGLVGGGEEHSRLGLFSGRTKITKVFFTINRNRIEYFINQIELFIFLINLTYKKYD